MDPKTESRIRDRAYQMWLEDGSPHGQSDAYWFRAEQEVLSAEAMDAAQISAHEEGPDRDAERFDPSGDTPTAGEAGPGHPQKPGEALKQAAPITAPKQSAKTKPSSTPVPKGDASAGPASSYGASSNAPAEAAAAAGKKAGDKAPASSAPASKAAAPAKASTPKGTAPKPSAPKAPRSGKTVN